MQETEKKFSPDYLYVEQKTSEGSEWFQIDSKWVWVNLALTYH